MDSVNNRIPGLRGARTFEYLSSYLELLRETTLASLLRIPPKDYSFIRMQLPNAMQLGDGSWQTHVQALVKYDEAHCRRAISCLVDVCVRLESIL